MERAAFELEEQAQYDAADEDRDDGDGHKTGDQHLGHQHVDEGLLYVIRNCF